MGRLRSTVQFGVVHCPPVNSHCTVYTRVQFTELYQAATAVIVLNFIFFIYINIISNTHIMSQDDIHNSHVTPTPTSPSHEAHSEADMVRRSISFHCLN